MKHGSELNGNLVRVIQKQGHPPVAQIGDGRDIFRRRVYENRESLGSHE